MSQNLHKQQEHSNVCVSQNIPPCVRDLSSCLRHFKNSRYIHHHDASPRNQPKIEEAEQVVRVRN